MIWVDTPSGLRVQYWAFYTVHIHFINLFEIEESKLCQCRYDIMRIKMICKNLVGFWTRTVPDKYITLTCRIIVQQILLIFWEKNTYTALLGPTRLLILRWYSTYTFIQTYTIIKFWENFLPATKLVTAGKFRQFYNFKKFT